MVVLPGLKVHISDRKRTPVQISDRKRIPVAHSSQVCGDDDESPEAMLKVPQPAVINNLKLWYG